VREPRGSPQQARRRRLGALGTIGAATIALGGMALAEPLAAEQPAAPVGQQITGRQIAVTIPGREPVSLYVEEHGSGEPVLLLHGLGESLYTWHEIVPALALRRRVIALDLKGFGRSDKPDDGAYAADDQAALVARFILDQDLSGLTLVGHSFGGTVALRTALADGIEGSKRIRRIAVIAAPALPAATSRELDLVTAPLIPDTVALVLPPEQTARFLLTEAMGGTTPSAELIEGYAAPYYDPRASQTFLATARSIVNERDTKAVVARYKAIKQLVLVAWCRKDPFVPLRSGRKLARALPRTRFVVLEGCHHLPQHEQPKQLLAVLGKFLD